MPKFKLLLSIFPVVEYQAKVFPRNMFLVLVRAGKLWKRISVT